jgi:hypothetical protein
MEQNNFEKNVQQKMDELKIAPSESVWTNVEKRIAKKDKDKKVIFILFFLILLLLSGSFWLLNSSKDNQGKNQQLSKVTKKGKERKAFPPDRTSLIENNQDSSFENSKITSAIIYPNADSKSVSVDKTKKLPIDSENKMEKWNEKKQRKLSDEPVFEYNADYSKQTNSADSDIVLNAGNLMEKRFDISDIENKKSDEILKDNILNKIEKDDFTSHLKTEKTAVKFISGKDSSVGETSKAPHKSSWVFGVVLSGGASLVSNNILERNYPSMDFNAGPPPAGIPSGTPTYFSASPIKNSTAFIAGVFVEKDISPKIKISLGISYKYYSLTNKVGYKIDSLLSSSTQYFSALNTYGSPNASRSYRNNFHYLELPVSLKFQLNKNKKLPLFWNVGINISELIGSNALQFQSNSGLYFNDNSMFHKTQFGLSTGLSVTIFAAQKMPFTFGPYFYYGASKLADKGLYQNKHFSFIGLQAEILFHKK